MLLHLDQMSNLKRNISSLLKEEAEQHGVMLNLKRIKLPKSKQTLHKPIKDVQDLQMILKTTMINFTYIALLTYGFIA